MRNFIICATLSVVLILAIGCAKEVHVGSNDANQRYYNAWVTVQKEAHPEYLWLPFSYGNTSETGEVKDYAYILEQEEGNGVEVADSEYLYVHYSYYDLDGNVQGTTDMTLSHKTNTNYDLSYYYGPVVWPNDDAYVSVVISDMIAGTKDGKEEYGSMRIGGRRKVVMPGWLTGETRYDTAAEYLAKVSGSNVIYDVTIMDATSDILQYQIDSIENFCYRHFGSKDSTYTGFYYFCDNTPADTVYTEDTTIYVNYIGRLLNGQVFDTTIADTAKVWNIYNASYSYEPAEINWSTDSTAVTLSESTVITGFASQITRMIAGGQSSIAVFYSPLGYSSSGSGYLIPSYSPLMFEVTTVEEDD